jgi:Zn-dependent peptidase ImmA (M78 family)
MRKYKTSNPFELANELKIKIMYEPLGNIKGFYQSCPRNKVIHINSSLNEKDKLIVCANEVGHAVLHAKLNILFLEHNTFYIKNKYENEANLFAAELLIRDDLLLEYKGYTANQISAAEDIHIELLRLKFNNLSFLNQMHCNNFL